MELKFNSSVFALLLAATLFTGCNRSGRNIKAYYFPVEDLRAGKVYVFAAADGDSTDQDYWYYQGIETDSGTFMSAQYFDRQFVLGQEVREKIVGNGVLARNYVLYDPDTLNGRMQKIEARLVAPNTFPFEVNDSTGVFLFHLEYHPAMDAGTTIYMIRNRRFLGDGPAFIFNGKSYPTIRFGLRELYGNEQEGTLEIEGTGEEQYAQGIGLVYYSRSVADGKYRLAYRLKEIVSLSTLEARSGQKLTRHPE